MTAPDIDIQPGTVESAGHALGDVATTAATHTAHALDSSAGTAKSHSGWSAGKSLAGCATAWEQHMSTLVGTIGDLGDRLVSSARQYSQVEQQIAAGFGDALHKLDS
jgi:uncharacterized protein YukE